MASWQTTLQPMLKSTGASQDQEVRFAAPTRGAITVVPWINVLANASSSAPAVKFYGATSLDLNPDVGQTVPFWPQLSTVISVTANQPGAYSGAAFTYAPPYIRWSVSGVTGSFTFEIILLCWDGVGTSDDELGGAEPPLGAQPAALGLRRKLQLARQTIRDLSQPVYSLPQTKYFCPDVTQRRGVCCALSKTCLPDPPKPPPSVEVSCITCGPTCWC